mmetsp:Transcript_31217/g.75462  ORF Transcript_31217/g.75462 Transcript_31217/m.75462 type:complete len:522 (+) Transcript_31217:378-1943(+)
MENPNSSSKHTPPPRHQQHAKYAGRVPAGLQQPVVLKKNGVRHLRRLPSGEDKEVLSVGLACSEVFSGPRLGKLLRPGFDYERSVMEQLMSGDGTASPLSNHTSGGVLDALSDFVSELEKHLPWKDSADLDWCVSLQLEGASAVWAAIDMVLQESFLTTGNFDRNKVAVGSTSYHGPPSTSFGSKCPLWKKDKQVLYPTPEPGQWINIAEYESKFKEFLDEHGAEVGVILFEPQWGSSKAGFPWPKQLLKSYISMAKERGIKVVTDEIMCGLGRHGHGTLFVSTVWDLDPDAVTFGKAIGGGVYPLSGAILKQGREKLCEAGCTVMQSHTYAGSSVRGLMTATEVLRELPHWFSSITKLGSEMKSIFAYLARISNGMILAHGQGLMWGWLFTKDGLMSDTTFRSSVIQSFKKQADIVGILPYFVPTGGLMVSPCIDIDVGTVYEIGQRLEEVLYRTMDEVGWNDRRAEEKEDLSNPAVESHCQEIELDKLLCQPHFHRTKSCTSCDEFVCPTVRRRFVTVN